VIIPQIPTPYADDPLRTAPPFGRYDRPAPTTGLQSGAGRLGQSPYGTDRYGTPGTSPGATRGGPPSPATYGTPRPPGGARPFSPFGPREKKGPNVKSTALPGSRPTDAKGRPTWQNRIPFPQQPPSTGVQSGTNR